MSRFPPIPPSEMSGEAQKAYQYVEDCLANQMGVDVFQYKDETGAFIGPFGILMYTPNLIKPYFGMFEEMSKIPGLPARTRETAILATGSVFQAKYERYAHMAVGKVVGLSETQVELIAAGVKPTGEHALDQAEEVAFDVGRELAGSRGPLSEENWNRAEKTFGKVGAAGLLQYIAIYSYICVLLNGMDALAP